MSNDPYLDAIDDRIAELEGKSVKSLAGTTGTIPSQEMNYDQALNNRIAFLEGQDYDPTLDTKTGLQDNKLRMMMGFASTPEGRESVLRNAGYQTERTPDGRLLYLNKDTGMRTYVDEDGMSLADLSDLVGLAPEVVGDYAGTAVGAAGGPIGATVGGSVGSAIGKGVQIGASKLMGIEEDVNIPKELGISAGASALGNTAGKVIGKAFAPVKNKLHPGAVEADDMLRARGSGMTASQMSESSIVDWFEEIAAGSFGGGPVIAKAKQGQRHAFTNMMNDIMEGLGNHMSKDEIGIMANKALLGKQDFFMDRIAPPLFKRVDEATKGIYPNTKPLKEYVEDVSSKLKYNEVVVDDITGNVSTKAGEMMKSTTNPHLRRLYKDILALPDEITFEQAQLIRSRLLKSARDLTESGKIGTDTGRQMNALAHEFDGIMDVAADEFDPDTKKLWRSVNAIYKQGMEVFHDRFIEALAKKDPEALVNAVIKKDNITNIMKVKKLLGKTDKETWDRMGSFFLKDTLGKLRFDDITKTSPAKQLKHKLFTEVGEKTLKLVYDDPAVYKGLKEVIDAAVLAEEKGLASGASVAIKLAQFGAVLQLATGAGGETGDTAAYGVLVGPYILAKLMTSKQGVKWLSKGLLQGPETREGAKAIKSILTFVAKEESSQAQKRKALDRGPQSSTTTRVPY